MNEHEVRGLQDGLHNALIRAATSIDGVTPLEIARVATEGPATLADADTFVNSVRLTAQLRAVWSDHCPSPGLLARSVPQQGDTADHRDLAAAVSKMVAIHAAECPRCTALLTVLASDSAATNELMADLGRAGWDWVGPVRPLSDDSPDGVDITVLGRRLLVRADAGLVGAVVYVTVARAEPEIRRAVLQPKGNRVSADLSLPAAPGHLYVDIAVQRRSAAQLVERVDMPSALAAAEKNISTVDRRRINDVLLTAADGRTARLRVKTGTGYSGSAIEVRLIAEPPGGLWTVDGRRLVVGKKTVIESQPRQLRDALTELMLGAVDEVRRVY